jgi:two-component system, OmpR family, phosphate regulon response regulator PhoB
MAPPPPALRVLIVDDNRLIRRLLGLIVEGAGFVAIEAESAEVALDVAREEPPHAWLVDEVMPGMTGSELIRALRSSRDPRLSGAAVVGISGRVGARMDLLGAGADAFVAKPVDEHTVLAALARAVQARCGGPEHVPAA